MSRSILVVAGEVSGDMHAAGLVRAVLARRPDVRFWGIGGDALREAGMEILRDAKEMAVLGLHEVLRKYSFFRRVFDELSRAAAERRPDAVLLVDYPGFNLRFAARAKALGIKVVYYICPQVWAWHRSRIPRMARLIDRLVVIFPFEPAVFAGTGLRTDYVGHPLVDEARRAADEPAPASARDGAPRVALLPGSREQELERLLPPMVRAAALLEKPFPGASFTVAAASRELADAASSMIRGFRNAPKSLSVVAGSTRQILRSATAAVVKSGTSTVEAALMGCPMIVVYKTLPLTYWFGRRLVRVPHLGMVNLIAGSEICPELLQHDVTPANLSQRLTPLLTDTPERRKMMEDLAGVRASLGEGGASERAAEILLEEIGLGRTPNTER
jgi:lipid-A-disaccharide synthase